MSVIIKASEIKSETISDAIEEIASDYGMRNRIEAISNCYNWSIGDTIEAVATYIVYNDEDYTMDENWKK